MGVEGEIELREWLVLAQSLDLDIRQAEIGWWHVDQVEEDLEQGMATGLPLGAQDPDQALEGNLLAFPRRQDPGPHTLQQIDEALSRSQLDPQGQGVEKKTDQPFEGRRPPVGHG